jgi:UDP-N-acetylmuramoyl-tripeptide--D-alanyl-D-alanine ligase
MRVVSSPASFNNRMGLARAINENLAPGAEVFIAEMGTYGPGEIAEMCAWIPPGHNDVAIGRCISSGSGLFEHRPGQAEILDQAEVGVICIDLSCSPI